ncbi:MAG: hydrogen gas-evolving membrane-bound hydrogenase subunit E [Halobacteria archaeon]
MSHPLYALIIAIFLPFLASFVLSYLYKFVDDKVGYVAAGVAGVSLFCVLYLFLTDSQGVHSFGWIDVPGYSFEVSFLVDGLSILMSFIVAFVGVMIMVYGRGYMKGEGRQGVFFAYLLAFMGSMMGVVFSDNIIVLFVFWELTSLTSFLLIGFYWNEDESLYGSRKSLLITVTGGLFMLVGFLLLHSISGTFSISAMNNIAGSALYVPAFLLILLGIATKSAQYPFHIWLPNAMEAPTPVSAFLHSATMVKAGVFLLGRMSPVLRGGDAWILTVGSLGMVTMFVAAVLATQANDIKGLLAYSTVSHLGLITATIGFASKVGSKAGTFHILNHATFKATLFLVAGIVVHAIHSRKLDEMGGLLRELPVTAFFACIASLSMAGVPPFNGFISKELMFEATLEMMHDYSFGWIFPVVGVAASIFTFLYSIRFYSSIFLGEKTEKVRDGVTVPSLAERIPVALLGIAILVITVAPDGAAQILVEEAVNSVHGVDFGFHPHHPTSITPELIMSGITIGSGILLYRYIDRISLGIRDFLSSHPRYTVDWYYDGWVNGMERLSGEFVPRVDTGYFRTYAAWLISGALAVVLSGFLVSAVNGFNPFDVSTTLNVGGLSLFSILLMTVAASVVLPFARSHVEGVLILSIVGFMVGIFYVIVSAPDLAMTQIVVETITLVVFLLVIERLPQFYVETGPGLKKGKNLVISLAAGATVTLLVLTALSRRTKDKIGDVQISKAVPEGGGHNVVNVILVDFRGFDTLGEVVVVSMAAFGVLTLFALRGYGRSDEIDGGDTE